MNTEEQAKLVSACKAHDRTAMEKLYTMYVSRMIAISMRYCKHQTDAEDIVQEAFIKVFKNIHRYNHTGVLGSWIERIVTNCAIDHWKKTKKTIYLDHENFESQDEIHSVDPSETDALLKELSIEKLRVLITDLPEQYRYVLNLYAIEGYSHKEIGHMLNIKESTSRSNYTRAKKKLLERIIEHNITY
ncbi:RNA polymerase sigma factor [Aquimarina sp. U1-2]|uniref:RNA polymerase sigma factor n=1 Tax=Aquimarina sp. U1-2 TaxID=2823141 RepID=UPI001AECAF6C|nr:RNA polymerase sigma factor [Aquimarina sp. U1-2]MBP2834052.1 RNA polymerase sigma factor [Aquimarina sp. U1-2]